MSALQAHHTATSDEHLEEFQESDVWAVIYKPAVKIPTTNSRQRPLRKPVIHKSPRLDGVGDHPLGFLPRSLPVNIPDWSKILGRDHGERANTDYDQDEEDNDEDEEDEEDRMPPHVYLARTRVASLSVHEGVGRTLKGRDMSRVRNSIWKQTGFEQD